MYNSATVGADPFMRNGGVTAADVRSEVERILASPRFRNAHRLCGFLRHVVEASLTGASLKEYSIAVAVFERAEDFDPRIDPIVRVQAVNLRLRLREYYDHEGRKDPVRIELPKGAYAAVFHPACPERRRPARLLLIALIPALVAAVALAGVLWWRAHPRAGPSPDQLTRLTFHAGSVAFPAVCRDGSRIVYASDEGGRDFDLWMKRLGDGDARRLTSNPANDRHPDLAPDGDHVVYRSERDGGGIYLLSIADKGERRIADGGYNPRFSPDGKWIAYSGDDRKVRVVPAGGGSSRGVNPQCRVAGGGPVWSPRGDALLCACAASGTAAADWWVLPLDGRPPVPAGVAAALAARRLGPLNPQIFPNDWAGDSVLCSLPQGDSANIWEIPVSPATGRTTGALRQVTFGPGSQTYPRALDGGRLVFVNEQMLTHLWSFPMDPVTDRITGEPVQLSDDASLRPGWYGTRPRMTPDGSKLVFTSRRSGNSDVWLLDLGARKETAVTATPWDEENPLISPDGLTVTYNNIRSGRRSIVASTIDGGPALELCENCGWLWDRSADGRFVLFGAGDPPALSLLEVAAGRKTQLIPAGTSAPRHGTFSPDGRRIAWISDGGERLLAAPLTGTKLGPEWTVVATGVENAPPQWGPRSDSLYFFAERDGFRCLFARRLRDGRPDGEAFAVHHFHHVQSYPWIGSPFSVARGRLVVPLTQAQCDLWMLTRR